MSSEYSFSALVLERANEWPNVAELIAAMLHAARQRNLPVDRSGLFHVRHPDYWANESDRLARRCDAWRGLFQSQDMNALRTAHETATRSFNDLATGQMNMGKAYQRIAAHRQITLLDELIRLKATGIDWPSVDELIPQEEGGRSD